MNLGQLNFEKMVREMGEEEATRMLKKIVENNTKISELQSMLVILIRKEKEPCIRLIQENSIENSVQDCLSYILRPHGPCYSTSSLP